MVPYDRLQDVEVDEPAGNSCFCVRNVISTVKVQTAAGGGVTASGASVPGEFAFSRVATSSSSPLILVFVLFFSALTRSPSSRSFQLTITEVTLRGLKRPHEFRKVMIALKKHAETAPGYRDMSGVGKGGAKPPPAYHSSEGSVGVGGESVALLTTMAGSAQRQEVMLSKHLEVLSDIASTLKTAHAVGV
jgi:hypothetical protein